MPTLEFVAMVVQVVHLRQAGIARTAVEDHLVRELRLPRHATRRLIGQVDHELQLIGRRLKLPLALSAEALRWDCVETPPRQPTGN
ncbi:MAG TPA: hypothetical protein VG370_17930 [Chloroflexota bacterium]|jgi:hypothetical protein|nr:hypothetical protein [Chloroflexota bacterium]